MYNIRNNYNTGSLDSSQSELPNDQKPNFTLHCDKVSAKAMQSLELINRTFTHLTKESFLMLYKTYIRPHLEYCVATHLESLFN